MGPKSLDLTSRLVSERARRIKLKYLPSFASQYRCRIFGANILASTGRTNRQYNIMFDRVKQDIFSRVNISDLASIGGQPGLNWEEHLPQVC